MLLLGVLIFGVLQEAPGPAQFDALAGMYLFAPLAAVWFALTIAHRNGPRDPWASLLTLGLVVAGLFGSSGQIGLWWSVLVAPLLIFLGFQKLDERELRAARSSVRTVLFLACALQVLLYLAAGVRNTFSLSYVFARHTDIDWWVRVGDPVLGNPNNASVVFCAGLAWAVAERVAGRRDVASVAFLFVSTVAVLVTGSRGAILTALLLGLLGVALDRRSRWLVSVALAAMAAVWVFASDAFDELSFVSTGASASVGERWGARVAAVPVVLGDLFGSGVGSVASTLSPSLAPVFGYEGRGATSHDLFLNWGVATGLVGLLLLVVALWMAFRRSAQATGWLPALPLIGYLVAGESAGVDVLTSSRPAWAVVLWALVGLAWRGSITGSGGRPGAPPTASGSLSNLSRSGSRR